MYAYSRIEYESEMIDQMIESEMHKLKERTINALSISFAHSPFSIKELLLTVAYGYWESNEHAITVSEQMNLGKLEFLAIQEDFEGFREYFKKENF